MPLYNPSGSSLTVEEEDGNPSVAGVTKIQVTNGKLINDSGTIVSLDLTTGVASSVTFVGCVATRTTDQTAVATDVLTSVVFNGTDEFDSDAFHDPATNNTRITIPTGKDGYYEFSYYIIFQDSATGYRRVSLLKNGVVVLSNTVPAVATAGVPTQMSGAFPVRSAVATDYFELQVLHNHGSDRTLIGATATLRFGAARVGV